MEHPYLMHKKSFLYVANTPDARKVMGVDGLPITAEQARSLDRDGVRAGTKILYDVVAEDNRRALAEAQARIAAMEGAAPAPAEESAPAEGANDNSGETEPDRPWGAKAIKGNPPKKDLIAFLEQKGVADAASLPYDELKTVAATYGWVAEHEGQ